MKVVFDTNVILDAAMGRPGFEVAQELIQAVIRGEMTGVVTANTITDIHYIVKKRAGEEKARAAVYNVLVLFDIAPVDGTVCMAALRSPVSDYEDAVLVSCAAGQQADCIVTGDRRFLDSAGSPVPVKRPEEIAELLT